MLGTWEARGGSRELLAPRAFPNTARPNYSSAWCAGYASSLATVAVIIFAGPFWKLPNTVKPLYTATKGQSWNFRYYESELSVMRRYDQVNCPWERCPYYRGRDYMNFGLLWTKWTVRNREVWVSDRGRDYKNFGLVWNKWTVRNSRSPLGSW